MPRAKDKTKSLDLDLTKEEHATIKRRAKAVGLSMHAYGVEFLVTGKISIKKK